jgi:hypothetical protein
MTEFKNINHVTYTRDTYIKIAKDYGIELYMKDRPHDACTYKVCTHHGLICTKDIRIRGHVMIRHLVTAAFILTLIKYCSNEQLLVKLLLKYDPSCA